jgi:OmpA-OmpF porin, OOP family
MKRLVLLCSLLALAACVPPPPAPPSVPPPPPPMAAAPVFTVYFGWDRATVGPAGWKILRQAADVFRSGGHPVVRITGYTDTSGMVGRNARLARRRAERVAHILARMGVPWRAMTIGIDSGLAVPTAPGVVEPRNRRVTIME